MLKLQTVISYPKYVLWDLRHYKLVLRKKVATSPHETDKKDIFSGHKESCAQGAYVHLPENLML